MNREPDFRRMLIDLVHAELAALNAGTAALSRAMELTVRYQIKGTACLLPPSEENDNGGTANALAVWAEWVEQMAALPRFAGMRFYHELALSRAQITNPSGQSNS